MWAACADDGEATSGEVEGEAVRHFAFQAAFYILANIGLALSVDASWVVAWVAAMIVVPGIGLGWVVAHRQAPPA